MEITQDLVKEIFEYKDGFLYWKIRGAMCVRIGDRTGSLHKLINGDRYRISIKAKGYLQSRIIFLYHKGYLPKVVDHEDRNKLNDKIENLRAADFSKNMKNRTSAKGSTSQYLGVSFYSRDGNWQVSIKNNKENIHLGFYKNEQDAALIYNKAAVRYHGEFANLNIIKP